MGSEMCIRDRQGLDLAGGTRLVLEAQTEKLPAKEKWDVDKQNACLLYTSDAADDLLCVDLGGRRIIKKTGAPDVLLS